VTASLATSTIAAPLRPLAETAALFRQECSAFDHLVAELYRDVEQLRDELFRKSDELEEGRRKLAQRGAQLADQRKETARLVHLAEQQEDRLNQTLAEIKSLREQAASQRQESFERETKRIATLEEKLRSAEEERDTLRQQIATLQAAASSAAISAVAMATTTTMPANHPQRRGGWRAGCS
jgi:chromosome segregation ATPase